MKSRKKKIIPNWCHAPNILNKGNWIVSQTKHTAKQIVSNYFQFLHSIQIWPMAQAEDTTNMFIQLVDHSLHFFSSFIFFWFVETERAECFVRSAQWEREKMREERWKQVSWNFSITAITYAHIILRKRNWFHQSNSALGKNLANEWTHTQEKNHQTN